MGYVEDVARIEEWSDDLKVQITRLKLLGAARRLVDWNEELRSPACTWDLLKSALIDRFEKKLLPGEAICQFRKCRQKMGESVVEFCERLQMLGGNMLRKSGDPVKDAMAREIFREECLQQFMGGLLMPVQQRVMSSNPATFEDAVQIAEREEQIEEKLHKKPFQRAIDIDAYGDNKPPKTGEQAGYCKKNGQNNEKKQVCYRCGGTDHVRENCKACYECGRMGHWRRDCYVYRRRMRNGNGQRARAGAETKDLNENRAVPEESGAARYKRKQ